MTTRNETAFHRAAARDITPKPKPVAEPYDTFAANGNHHALAQTETVDVYDCVTHSSGEDSAL